MSPEEEKQEIRPRETEIRGEKMKGRRLADVIEGRFRTERASDNTGVRGQFIMR